MELSKILGKKNITLDLKSSDKFIFLAELAEFLCKTNNLKNVDNIKEAIIKREKQDTTGIGKQIAIPHARISGINKTFAVCAVVKDGLDFDSLDGKPVKLVFMLVSSQDAPDAHIKALSKMANILNNDQLCESIINANTVQEIYAILKEN